MSRTNAMSAVVGALVGALSMFFAGPRASTSESSAGLAPQQVAHATPEAPSMQRAPAMTTANAPAPSSDAGSGSAPALATQSVAQLVARIEAQQAQIDQLIAERASRSTTEEGHPRARRGFFDFTPEDLKDMAKNCEVRFAVPPLSREPWVIDPEKAAELKLSEAEQRQLIEAVNSIMGPAAATVRSLYVEATGDKAGADTLEISTMAAEIQMKGRDVDVARAALANERAGLAQPPTDLSRASADERYLRLLAGLQDAVRQAVEARVGPQEAKRLRDLVTDQRMVLSGCPPK